jgi:hypothetical protein
MTKGGGFHNDPRPVILAIGHSNFQCMLPLQSLKRALVSRGNKAVIINEHHISMLCSCYHQEMPEAAMRGVITPRNVRKCLTAFCGIMWHHDVNACINILHPMVEEYAVGGNGRPDVFSRHTRTPQTIAVSFAVRARHDTKLRRKARAREAAAAAAFEVAMQESFHARVPTPHPKLTINFDTNGYLVLAETRTISPAPFTKIFTKMIPGVRYGNGKDSREYGGSLAWNPTMFKDETTWKLRLRGEKAHEGSICMSHAELILY